MRSRAALVAVVLIAAACGGPADTTTTTEAPATTIGTAPTATESPAPTTTEAATDTATTPPASAGGELVLSSLSFGESSMVVITNIGEGPASLEGHFLCQRPAYHGLEPVELAPGQSYAISTGGSVFLPPPAAIVSEDVAAIGVLSQGGGEVGLYSSSDFGNAGDILSYVEWGSDGHGRSGTAQAAGIWSGFVPTNEAALGVGALVLPALSAADWAVLKG